MKTEFFKLLFILFFIFKVFKIFENVKDYKSKVDEQDKEIVNLYKNKKHENLSGSQTKRMRSKQDLSLSASKGEKSIIFYSLIFLISQAKMKVIILLKQK